MNNSQNGDEVEDEATTTFGSVQLSTASIAILGLWIENAQDSMVKRGKDKAIKLRKDLDDLLEQMPEEDDWFFGADVRLSGEDIRKSGEELMLSWESSEGEARMQAAQLEETFSQESAEIRRESEEAVMSLDKAIREAREQGIEEAERRIVEMTSERQSMAEGFAEEEKDAPVGERAKLVREHTAKLTSLDESIKGERGRQLQRVEDKMEEKRAQVRDFVAKKQSEIAIRRRNMNVAKRNMMAKVQAEFRPKEAKWEAQGVVWIERAKRKVDAKMEEDREHDKQKKRAKGGK
jgi:hypothetical protein